MRSPRLISTLALGASLSLAGLAGCVGAPKPVDSSLQGKNTPRCLARARALEDMSIKDVAAGNSVSDLDKRREKYDAALDKLHQARQLYVDELLHDPGTPEKQRVLNSEINRLSARIDELVRERPIN